MEFAAGCGSERLLADLVENEISDAEFERERKKLEHVQISSKEELYYFRIFRSFFNTDGMIEAIGRWEGGFASEGSDR
ncbi:MAG: hypothetical protein V3T71_00765, partial [Dehalococcoidia bacterium]